MIRLRLRPAAAFRDNQARTSTNELREPCWFQTFSWASGSGSPCYTSAVLKAGTTTWTCSGGGNQNGGLRVALAGRLAASPCKQLLTRPAAGGRSARPPSPALPTPVRALYSIGSLPPGRPLKRSVAASVVSHKRLELLSLCFSHSGAGAAGFYPLQRLFAPAQFLDD